MSLSIEPNKDIAVPQSFGSPIIGTTAPAMMTLRSQYVPKRIGHATGRIVTMPFDPLWDLPGLLAAYDGVKGTATTWPDSSGNGFDGTSKNPPVLATGMNGKQVFRFTRASGHYFDIGFPAGPNKPAAWSIYALGQCSNVVVGAQMIHGSFSANGLDKHVWGIVAVADIDGSGAPAGSFGAGFGDDTDFSYGNTAGNLLANDTPFVISTIYPGEDGSAKVTTYLNGTKRSLNLIGGAAATSTSGPAHRSGIGRAGPELVSGSTDFFGGDLLYLWIGNVTHTAKQRQQMETWLKAYGGFSIHGANDLAGLQAYWSADNGELAGGTAADSKDGHTLTDTGTVTRPLGHVGTGNSFGFSGTGQYLSFAPDAAWRAIFAGDYTVSMWVKSTSTTMVKRLWGQSSAADGFHTALLNWPAAGQLRFYNGSGLDPEALTSVASNLNDGSWRHLIFQRKGINISIYVNGVLDSARVFVAAGDVDDNFFLGLSKIGNPAGQAFEGQIDDVAIYNRALSIFEIQQLYNEGAGVGF